jgi:hypothetical protein
VYEKQDRLCGVMFRVPGYRSRVPGSIPGATRFSEKKWALNGVQRYKMNFEILFKKNIPRL